MVYKILKFTGLNYKKNLFILPIMLDMRYINKLLKNLLINLNHVNPVNMFKDACYNPFLIRSMALSVLALVAKAVSLK